MRTTRILGHRGYRSKYTENTLESFSKALLAGADGIELDIQKTGDNRFVIFHDLNLDRMSGINASINTLDYAELHTIKIGKTHTIPLLNELFPLIDGNTFVNVELKESVEQDDLEDIYTLLISHIDPKHLLISSFNHSLLPFFNEKHIMTGMLIGEEQQNAGILRTLISLFRIKPVYINPPINGFSEINKYIYYGVLYFFRLFNFKIAFYTVNTEQEFKLIKNLADIIITDNPEKMLALVERKNNE